MKYEVIQAAGEWIVQSDGAELARFAEQDQALEHVAARLRDVEPGPDAVSLRVRYEARD
ncbi:hypothetical protein [Phenylobacterium sp.]|uniref:hypothetical protein n=1 Tax=Phenylobacterium sp. TaxID=1871053 RepID=UPI002DEAB006|nr:hypothetical protein [Phenylobacterium sp.]